jgi:hypothetical protein
MRLKPFVFSLLALALPALAGAQTAPRTLEVPITAAWKHAATEMILPANAGGLARTRIRDLGGEELDIVADYEDRAEGVWVTIYLYQTGAPDVPLWFDRALGALLARPEYGAAAAAPPTPVAFPRPGAVNASGLRVSIDANGAEVRSTGVAIAPLGPFQLKLRISSSRLDRAALDERLTRFIAALRWPAETGRPAPAAIPVAPCATALQLRQARLIRSDDADSLMDALLGVDVSDVEHGEAPPPIVYCREPGGTPAYGVYRPNAARNEYLIALNDAGIAYSVGEALDLGALTGQGSSGRRFSMAILNRNMRGVVASFNRLPPPEQALSVAQTRGPSIMVTTSPTPRN